jgi:hypothetical protein
VRDRTAGSANSEPRGVRTLVKRVGLVSVGYSYEMKIPQRCRDHDDNTDNVEDAVHSGSPIEVVLYTVGIILFLPLERGVRCSKEDSSAS